MSPTSPDAVLVTAVKEWVAHDLTTTLPGDDPTPILMYLGADGEATVVAMFGDDMNHVESKNELARMMIASLITDGAIEAAFTSCAWTVDVAVTDHLDCDPADHPDRREEVILVHVTRDGEAFHHAPVLRFLDGAPELGNWVRDTGQDGPAGGRFGVALRFGLDLATSMPSPIRAMLDQVLAEEGREAVVEHVVTMVARALRRIEEEQS